MTTALSGAAGTAAAGTVSTAPTTDSVSLDRRFLDHHHPRDRPVSAVVTASFAAAAVTATASTASADVDPEHLVAAQCDTGPAAAAAADVVVTATVLFVLAGSFAADHDISRLDERKFGAPSADVAAAAVVLMPGATTANAAADVGLSMLGAIAATTGAGFAGILAMPSAVTVTIAADVADALFMLLSLIHI